MTDARIRSIGRLVVFLATAVITAWTWRAWPDVFVDFGRELYLPWRVNEGDVLYRDLAAFNGPLSVYWNSLWMSLFGGFTGLIVSNLILLALLLVLLARLFERMASPLASYAALLFFVVVFAFGQTSGVGNYEFVSPYAHEATHGFLLGVAALFAMSGREIGGRRWFVVGVLLGLVFLTKLELFVASSAAVAIGVLLKESSVSLPKRFVAVASGALLPVVAAVLLLGFAMSPEEAVAGLTASVSGAFGAASELPFYRGDLGAGIDRVGHNLTLMGFWFVGFFALVLLASMGEYSFPRAGWRLRGAVCAATIWGLSLLPVDWGYVGRPLPALVALFLLLSFFAWRAGGDAEERDALACRLTFLCFALFAMAKMILAAKLWHYGFVLASPAVAACMLYGLDWFPKEWRERRSSGTLVQAVFLGLFVFVGWTYGSMSRSSYADRTVEVGEGADRLVADARGTYAAEALRAVAEYVGPDETLLVLPEGISINYLAKRRTPTKYINFMPPEFALYGEDTMLAELQQNEPQAVLLVHKDTSEYGLPLFGRDYGARIFAWFEERYEQVWSYGDKPLTPEASFGVALYRRSED